METNPLNEILNKFIKTIGERSWSKNVDITQKLTLIYELYSDFFDILRENIKILKGFKVLQRDFMIQRKVLVPGGV